MPEARESAVGVLVRFARLLSSSKQQPHALLALLAEAGVEHLGAQAAAVLELLPSGEMRLAAGRNLPPELDGFRVDLDGLVHQLGNRLLAVCSGRYAHAQSLPLVAGGDLFGALVLLYTEAHRLQEEELVLAEGLVDLAALALRKAFEYDELSRSYAELAASREVLLTSEKLRSLGQMAAGVSHDLMNIFHPLTAEARILRRRLEQMRDAVAAGAPAPAGRDPAELLESVARCEQVLAHGIETVKRLRDFSRQTPETEASEVDLDEVVGEVAALARPRLPYRAGEAITLEVERNGPPRVRVHPSHLVTALLNLVVNAIEAMPSGGSIWLRTLAGDQGAIVEVADTGPGIPPEVQKRIFEPFFTTKGSEGTGLGLAMVYAFVQRHRGTIQVSSQPGKGTVFRLWFPPAAAPVQASGAVR